jgi:hypothetical protein
LRKYSENWQAKNEQRNEMVSKLKQEILKGELKKKTFVCKHLPALPICRKSLKSKLETNLLSGKKT